MVLFLYAGPGCVCTHITGNGHVLEDVKYDLQRFGVETKNIILAEQHISNPTSAVVETKFTVSKTITRSSHFAYVKLWDIGLVYSYTICTFLFTS